MLPETMRIAEVSANMASISNSQLDSAGRSSPGPAHPLGAMFSGKPLEQAR